MASVTNPAIKSYLDFLYDQRKTRWEKIINYRDYSEGDSESVMTDDQKILLVGADDNGNPNSDSEASINVSSIILKAETDRLQVRSISVVVPDNEELSDEVNKAVWSWWERSGTEENSYFSASRDGDSYPIVDYDDDYPRFTLNMAYDGSSGTEMAYEDGHPEESLYAVKRWNVQRPTVGNTSTNRVRRMNVYFNNRVEYYITAGQMASSSDSGWRPLKAGDRDYDAEMMETVNLVDAYNRPYIATVTWLTVDGTETGEPIGNPVKHMRHDSRGGPYGRSRIADIVPNRADAVNRAEASLQAATLLSGFKEVYVLNFFPEQDQSGTSGAIQRSPAAVHYIDGGGEQNVQIEQTQETDLNQLIAVLDKQITICATLTSTPLSLFNLSTHTPAEGTQKALEQALVTSVEASQRSYTRTWQDVIRQQLKFDTLYGGNESVLPLEMYEQIDEFDINIEWESAQTQNEKEEREIALLDVQLGAASEVVLEKFYTPEQIAKMEQVRSKQRGAVIGDMASQVLVLEQQNADALAAGQAVINSQNGSQNGVDNGANREPATASAG